MSATPLQAGPDDVMRELLAALLDPDAAPTSPLPRGTGQDGEVPLTEGQRQLWFLQQLWPDATTYHVCTALRLRGALHAPALEQALADLVARHPALRTTIRTGRRGRPQGVLHPPGGATAVLAAQELPGRTPEEREAQVQQAARAELAVPFDLATGPLIRARLLRFAREDHALVLTFHHLVVDGWSMRIVLRDLAAHYSARVGGRPAGLPELHHQYTDFAAWQQDGLSSSARYADALDHWRRTLAQAPQESTPPPDRAAGQAADQAVDRSGRRTGRSLHFDLPAATVRGVRALAAREASTPFAVCHAAFTLWLARATGRTDLVTGVPSCGRPFPELDDVVGYFVNLLPLRSRLRAEATFAETVRAAHAGVAAALDHDLLPFDRIVGALGVPRRPGVQPLAQVMCQLVGDRSVGGDADDWHGLAVTEVRILHDDEARFDLELDLREEGSDRIQGCLTVDARRYGEARAERIRDEYAALLGLLGRHPDTVLGPLLDGATPLPGLDDVPDDVPAAVHDDVCDAERHDVRDDVRDDASERKATR
ncbi:condensation domain-containing protein [Kitasatospora sp. NBC_01250]|uniref:condensation domain-containing protein n=1 Tax=Kitasatospora sp. NBC_01250 TaxID=2903571 RepID=UPI002E3155AE|nr:condensation domain-containing protein [Kitasatospora sp. NBC_01250]